VEREYDDYPTLVAAYGTAEADATIERRRHRDEHVIPTLRAACYDAWRSLDDPGVQLPDEPAREG